MNVSWIGWDADGVLLDSFSTASKVAEGILATLGIEARIGSPREYRAQFGRSRQENLVGADRATILRDMHRLAMLLRAGEIEVFQEVLEIVRLQTVPALIVTSSYAQGVSAILGERSAQFSRVLGFESGRKDQLLKQIASQGGGLYVTDASRDIQRCHSVELPVIAVSWGYESPDALLEARPVCLVKSPVELLEFLGTLNLTEL